MTLRIEFAGESIFMNDFWLCDCTSDNVRRKEEWIQCPKCRAREDYSPDAEIEHLLMDTKVLTQDERVALVRWVCEFIPRDKLSDIVVDCLEWEEGE